MNEKENIDVEENKLKEIERTVPTLKRDRTKKETKDLMNAIMNGDDEKLKTLISITEDINYIALSGGHSLLTFSCQHKRIEIVKYLIELGADVNKIDNIGYSSLMNAIYSGNIEIVQELINAGADINYIDNRNGNSALSQAAYYNNLDIFELLITSGVDIAKCGGISLIEASLKGNINIMQQLIELGVDVNYIHFQTGWTTLHYACDYNNLEIVELLMENGADENIKNDQGKTPIKLAKKEEIKDYIMNFNSSKFVLK